MDQRDRVKSGDRQRLSSGDRQRVTSGTGDPKKTSVAEFGPPRPISAVSHVRKKTWSQVLCEAVIATFLRLGLFAILVAYAFGGAALFHAIERPNQIMEAAHRKNQSDEAVETAVVNLMRLMQLHCNQIDYGDESPDQDNSPFVEECQSALRIALVNFKGPEVPEETWDFWHALFYCGTVFTTIGYGSLTCQTELGQIMTMFYALIGIPLTLTVLHDIGKSLYRGFLRIYRWTHRKLRHAVLYIYTRHGSKPQLLRMSTISLPDDTDDPYLPIWLAVAIVVVYMLLFSVIMLTWEKNWSYHKAFYFVFVSLSTIGFGDVIPENLNYMLASSVLIFIGLSMVSMCLNVIQAKLERTYRYAYDSMHGNFATGYVCSPLPTTPIHPFSPFTIAGAPSDITKPWKEPPEAAEGKLVLGSPRKKPFLPQGSLGVLSLGSILDDKEDEEENKVEKEEGEGDHVRWRKDVEDKEKY